MYSSTTSKVLGIRRKKLSNYLANARYTNNPLKGYNLSQCRRKRIPQKYSWKSNGEIYYHKYSRVLKKMNNLHQQVKELEEKMKVVEYFYHKKQKMKEKAKKKKKMRKNKKIKEQNLKAQNKAVKIKHDLQRHEVAERGYKFYMYALDEWERCAKQKGLQEKVAKEYKKIFERDIKDDLEWPIILENAIADYEYERDGYSDAFSDSNDPGDN